MHRTFEIWEPFENYVLSMGVCRCGVLEGNATGAGSALLMLQIGFDLGFPAVEVESFRDQGDDANAACESKIEGLASKNKYMRGTIKAGETQESAIEGFLGFMGTHAPAPAPRLISK